MSNRIQPSDITPFFCYYCFKGIRLESELQLSKQPPNLPYHRSCLSDALQDKQRFNLIQTLLDQWQLYQADYKIAYILNEIEEPVIKYNVIFEDKRFIAYVLTDSKFYVLSRGYDHFSNEFDDTVIIPSEYVNGINNFLNQ